MNFSYCPSNIAFCFALPVAFCLYFFVVTTGFIAYLDGTTQENKMRFIQNFKWTDTLQGNTPRYKQRVDALATGSLFML